MLNSISNFLFGKTAGKGQSSSDAQLNEGLTVSGEAHAESLTTVLSENEWLLVQKAGNGNVFLNCFPGLIFLINCKRLQNH